VFERDDGIALLPPGVNYNHGDSGDGKSLLAAIIALTELPAPNDVRWVTHEDANEELIVGRLRHLGANWYEVERLHFFAATDPLTSGVEQLAALATISEARLLVLDSIGEAPAVGGINEDRQRSRAPGSATPCATSTKPVRPSLSGPSTNPPRPRTTRSSRQGRTGNGPPSPDASTSSPGRVD
jgi:hypothetical protein